MLETTARIAGDVCTTEVLRAEFPKPVKHRWLGGHLIFTMMFRSASYHAEARYSSRPGQDFTPIRGVFMVPPEHELIGRGSGGEMRAVRCIYGPEAFEHFLQGRKHLSREQLSKALEMESTTITFYMQRLIAEALSPGFASEALADSIASALMIECGRQLFSPDAVAEERGQSGFNSKHMRRIEDYIANLEVGSPTVADVASLCGFSPHYFCKLFRQHTGQSIGRYLAHSRLRRAEKLLLETDMPLKEIAYRLGFANAANFSTSFRNEMKMTPGSYRDCRRTPGLIGTMPERLRFH